MSIARNIIRARKRKKLSRAQLAARLEVSRQAVSGWERGADLKLSNLRKISRITHVSLAELVGGRA